MIPGRLLQVQVFPVKSVPGLSLPAVEVRAEGLLGDRGFVLASGTETLVAKHHPALRSLALDGPPGAPRVAAPPAGPGDLRAVAARLGLAEVHLEPVTGGARQVAAVHVVTLRARRVEGAGDSSRANLVLDTDGWPEDPVEGDVLEVGPVTLRLGATPRHCAGSFAEVLRPGRVGVGDAVRRRNPVGGPG
ncbi:MOSC N-terminal beta barrel domain-containing protein [Kineococcus gynurae]|uniref:MOSC N-terminal beta barrel domain-containing protein n=1 Tax=Kineococcus gynurae TaxID=452979 RepID=A0ABV5LUX0_9ACTN